MLDFWLFKVLVHLQKPKGRTAQIERCNGFLSFAVELLILYRK